MRFPVDSHRTTDLSCQEKAGLYLTETVKVDFKASAASSLSVSP